MQSLTNSLRVTVLAACAMWLMMMRTPIVHAQLQNCAKYNTQNGVEVCNSCCSSHPSVNDWTDGISDGAGIQTLQTTYASCGSKRSAGLFSTNFQFNPIT